MIDIATLQRRAQSGDPEAQCRLAAHLATGDAIDKNESEALRWYLSAANQGHSEAQWNLGWMLINGEGASKDEREGVKWIEKAAAGSYIDAVNVLATFYEKGLYGYPKDPQKASSWRKRGEELEPAGDSK